MPEKRSNSFEIILYPDSLPEYEIHPNLFKEIIENTSVPCLLSPLHQFDKYNLADQREAEKELAENDSLSDRERKRLDSIKEGACKKPHFHLVVYYGKNANKTKQQVIEDFCIPLNAPKRVIICSTLRGRVRYTIHLDNPSKYQYHLSDVRCFNGFDVDDYFDLSNKDIDNMVYDILMIIAKYKISNYQELLFFTKSSLKYFRYVVNHSLFFNKYFEDSLIPDLEALDSIYKAGKEAFTGESAESN